MSEPLVYCGHRLAMNVTFAGLVIAAATKVSGKLKTAGAVAGALMLTGLAYSKEKAGKVNFDAISAPIKHLVDLGIYCGAAALLRRWSSAGMPGRIGIGVGMLPCGLYGLARIADSTTIPAFVLTEDFERKDQLEISNAMMNLGLENLFQNSEEA